MRDCFTQLKALESSVDAEEDGEKDETDLTTDDKIGMCDRMGCI